MGYYYQNNSGYNNVPPFFNGQNPNFPFSNVSPVDNGAVWFVAIAPAFSLFLEGITGNKIAAVLLWVFTYVLCVLVCAWDKKRVLSKFYDTKALGHLNFIPVLYLFKRKSVTRQSSMYPIVCVGCILVALLQNGFTQIALTNENDYIYTVQNFSCAEIIDFEEVNTITEKTVSEAVEDYLKHNEIIWQCEKGKEVSVVTASADCSYNGEKTRITIEFVMEYDGFAFGGIKIGDVILGGEVLKNEKRSTLLMQIFTEQAVSADTDAADSDKAYVEA